MASSSMSIPRDCSGPSWAPSSASPQPPAPSAFGPHRAAQWSSSASKSLSCISCSPLSSFHPVCPVQCRHMDTDTSGDTTSPLPASPVRTLDCTGGLFGPCDDASGLFPEPVPTPPAWRAAWFPAPASPSSPCSFSLPSSWKKKIVFKKPRVKITLSPTFTSSGFCLCGFKDGLTTPGSLSPADPPGAPLPSTEHHPQYLSDAEAQLHDVAPLRRLAAVG